MIWCPANPALWLRNKPKNLSVQCPQWPILGGRCLRWAATRSMGRRCELCAPVLRSSLPALRSHWLSFTEHLPCAGQFCQQFHNCANRGEGNDRTRQWSWCCTARCPSTCPRIPWLDGELGKVWRHPRGWASTGWWCSRWRTRRPRRSSSSSGPTIGQDLLPRHLTETQSWRATAAPRTPQTSWPASILLQPMPTVPTCPQMTLPSWIKARGSRIARGSEGDWSASATLPQAVGELLTRSQRTRNLEGKSFLARNNRTTRQCRHQPLPWWPMMTQLRLASTSLPKFRGP